MNPACHSANCPRRTDCGRHNTGARHSTDFSHGQWFQPKNCFWFKPVVLRDILRQYLMEHGFDGLYVPQTCACKNSDLMPCGEPAAECRAGYLVPESSEYFESEYDFMIGPKTHA